MKKLERDALLADREAVRQLLASIQDEDALGRLSFSSRLSDIDRQLTDLDQHVDVLGSVALMFGGGPVRGSRAIDAEFATTTLSVFQTLVSKKLALDELGSLGGRGPIPQHSDVRLSITELVRGSVGFLLEENGSNHEIAETPVRSAIDSVTELVAKTASESAVDFERAVESLDHRLLISLRDLFRTLDDSQATMQIVEDDREARLDAAAVRRGRERVETTEIEESESDSVIGELLGLLPESRRFEMRLRDSGEIIKGTVVAALAVKYLELIEDQQAGIVGRYWRTKMRIREVRERNKPPRRLYALVGLLESADVLGGPRPSGVGPRGE